MGWRGLRSVLVLLVAIAACTEPSEPSSISAQFILTDVDGVSLPAGSVPGPTIVSGTMVLNQLGFAAVTEDRVESNGTHTTITTHYIYTIRASQITFADPVPCPPNANCVAPPTGMILDNGLRVQLVFPPGYLFMVYNYRVSATP